MRITAVRIMGACICIGAVLMLLSIFRMDNFLASTLPGGSLAAHWAPKDTSHCHHAESSLS